MVKKIVSLDELGGCGGRRRVPGAIAQSLRAGRPQDRSPRIQRRSRFRDFRSRLAELTRRGVSWRTRVPSSAGHVERRREGRANQPPRCTALTSRITGAGDDLAEGSASGRTKGPQRDVRRIRGLRIQFPRATARFGDQPLDRARTVSCRVGHGARSTPPRFGPGHATASSRRRMHVTSIGALYRGQTSQAQVPLCRHQCRPGESG